MTDRMSGKLFLWLALWLLTCSTVWVPRASADPCEWPAIMAIDVCGNPFSAAGQFCDNFNEVFEKVFEVFDDAQTSCDDLACLQGLLADAAATKGEALTLSQYAMIYSFCLDGNTDPSNIDLTGFCSNSSPGQGGDANSFSPGFSDWCASGDLNGDGTIGAEDADLFVELSKMACDPNDEFEWDDDVILDVLIDFAFALAEGGCGLDCEVLSSIAGAQLGDPPSSSQMYELNQKGGCCSPTDSSDPAFVSSPPSDPCGGSSGFSESMDWVQDSLDTWTSLNFGPQTACGEDGLTPDMTIDALTNLYGMIACPWDPNQCQDFLSAAQSAAYPDSNDPLTFEQTSAILSISGCFPSGECAPGNFPALPSDLDGDGVITENDAMSHLGMLIQCADPGSINASFAIDALQDFFNNLDPAIPLSPEFCESLSSGEFEIMVSGNLELGMLIIPGTLDAGENCNGGGPFPSPNIIRQTNPRTDGPVEGIVEGDDAADLGVGDGVQPESCGSEGAGGCNTGGSGGNGGPIVVCGSGPTKPKRIFRSPVDLLYGDKIEQAIDLTVELPGADFSLRRSYRSAPVSDDPGAGTQEGIDGAGLVGENWSLSLFNFIYEEASGSGEPDLVIQGGVGSVAFVHDGQSKWLSEGTTDEYIERASRTVTFVDVNGEQTYTYPVYRYVRPGVLVFDYYRERLASEPTSWDEPDESLHGLPLVRSNMFQNDWLFEHSVLASGTRLRKITFQRGWGASRVEHGRALFSWKTGVVDGMGDPINAVNGKLSRVDVYRVGSDNLPYKTNAVEYTYQGEAGANFTHLGSAGDLVMVRASTLVQADDGLWSDWRHQYAQYRYHRSDLQSGGFNHALKSVIAPQQIEFLAGELSDAGGDCASSSDPLGCAAFLLLATEDTDPVSTTVSLSPNQLSAKLVSEYYPLSDPNYPGRVKTQLIQAGCGCDGGTSALKVSFEYILYSSQGTKQSTIVSEYGFDATTSTYTALLRREHTDFDGVEGTSEIVSRAIELVGTSPVEYLAWGFGYTASSDIAWRAHPSAVLSYAPATSSSAPSIDFRQADGHVEYFYFNDEHRLERVGVRKGFVTYDGTGPFPAGVQTTQEILYSTASGLEHLPDRQILWRSSTPSGEDDYEVVKYNYVTGGDDQTPFRPVLSRAILAERELQSENGPGQSGTNNLTVTRQIVFNEEGYLSWYQDADGSLTRFSTDSNTGAVIEMERNAAPPVAGLPANVTLGAGRHADGGSLTWSWTVDLLGRPIEIVAPDGRTTRIVRQMLESEHRAGNVRHYAMVMLPHVLDGGNAADGPATVALLDAADQPIEFATHELVASSLDVSDSGSTTIIQYALEEVPHFRSVVERAVTGAPKAVVRWTDPIQRPGYTERQSFSYDQFGRLTCVTAPSGDVERYVLDQFDRIVEVQRGLDGTDVYPSAPPCSTLNLVTVAKLEYDNAPGVSVLGDGQLIAVETYADASDPIGDNVRRVEMSYDWRNRLVEVRRPFTGEASSDPALPITKIEYDNLDRVIRRTMATGTGGTTPLHVVEFAYGQRGLPVSSSIWLDPAAGPSAGVLRTDVAYDAVGRVVAELSPSGVVSKAAYDGLGRLAWSASTDGSGTERPGTSGFFASVFNDSTHSPVLTGDRVLEQVVLDYADHTAPHELLGRGQPKLIRSIRRAHDSSSTGSLLNDATAISTYTGLYFDEAGRLIASAEFGTNDAAGWVAGGSPVSPGAAAPTPSESVLVTSVAFDEIGRLNTIVNPRQITSRVHRDGLGRVVAAIENYVDATITWNESSKDWTVNLGANPSSSDEDRVTTVTFNNSGQVATRSAYRHYGANAQPLRTVYQYSQQTAMLSAKNLLTATFYPDETPPFGNAIRYEYNSLGEVIKITDQRGVERTLHRDQAGRVVADIVTDGLTPSTALSDWADELRFTYAPSSGLGMLKKAQTFSGTTLLNEVQWDYDQTDAPGLWNLAAFTQEPLIQAGHAGVNRASVEYAHTTSPFSSSGSGAHNYSRPSTLAYPMDSGGKRTILAHAYGGAGSIDDRISRFAGFSWNVGDPTSNRFLIHSLERDYVGLGQAVETRLPSRGLRRSVFVNPDPGATSSTVPGEYPGLDRFGREVRRVWGQDNGSTAWSPSSLPAIIDLGFGYDANSNPTHRYDLREQASWSGRDERFLSDNLDRLTARDLGEVGGSGFTANAALVGTQQWSYDHLGNWSSFKQELDGVAGFTATGETINRSFNEANEMVFSKAGSDPWFQYDDAGNLIIETLSDDSRRRFKYDAWNRMVEVGYESFNYLTNQWPTGPPTARAKYTYHATNERATSLVDADGLDGDPDEWVLFYYDANWRLLERRIAYDYDATPTGGGSSDNTSPFSWASPGTFDWDETHQYVWDPEYIDQLLFFQHALITESSGDFITTTGTRSHFTLTDLNGSVIAVQSGSPELHTGRLRFDRIRYTPYGQHRSHPRGDLNGDGVANSADASLHTAALGKQLGDPGYFVEADLNHDGVIDAKDAPPTSGGVPAHRLAAGSPLIVGYAGYLWEPATGLYLARHRWYNPEAGRWLNRDPISYAGGDNNLYAYVGGAPWSAVDPFGLAEWMISRPFKWIGNQVGGDTLVGMGANLIGYSADRVVDIVDGTFVEAGRIIIDGAGYTSDLLTGGSSYEPLSGWGKYVEDALADGASVGGLMGEYAKGVVEGMIGVDAFRAFLEARSGCGSWDDFYDALGGFGVGALGGAKGGSMMRPTRKGVAPKPKGKSGKGKGASSDPVAEVAALVKQWLGDDAVIKPSKTSVVIQNANGTRQIRLDLHGHGKYPPHAHIEVRPSGQGRFKDAPGSPHHIYFQD